MIEQVEAKIRNFKGLNITIVHNPFYDISNNLISLWLARDLLREGFIIINGDDIFNPKVLHDLLQHKSNVCMVIDYKERYSEDDMKVVIQDGCISKVSKKIDLKEAHGESIGMIKFQKVGCKNFLKILEEMVKVEKNLNVFYLESIQKLIVEGFQVHYIVCKTDDWAEVDFHPDLEFIKSNIFNFQDVTKKWESS